MIRIITYPIPESENGRSIERFLKKHLYSHPDLAYLKRTSGSVLRNGAYARLIDILQTGDLLQIQIEELASSPSIQPASLPLSILYEDEDIIVVNKAAGMPTHPSEKNVDNSLASALLAYYEAQGIPFVFRCSNRLDQDTSGVTVVSKHRISGSILATMNERHLVEKEYLAIAVGHVTPAQGSISAPIGETTNGSLHLRTVNYDAGKPAVTHYEVVKTCGPVSLVRLKLETGRTHQIRVHMQHLGYPLIGDPLYGVEGACLLSEQSPIHRQALHAHRISFAHPITGEAVSFTAPLPDDMAEALRLCTSMDSP